MERVGPSRSGEWRSITSFLEACPGQPWMAQFPKCGLHPAMCKKNLVGQSPSNSGSSTLQTSPNHLNVLSQG